MKKLFTICILFFVTVAAFAQAPQSFNYQGVARNTTGTPYVNQTMNIRLSIHTGTASGNIEYAEVRTITTNAFGLFTVQVGSAGANSTQGNFLTVSWAAEAKYLQSEVNLPGTLNYIDLGTVKLQSVPYSLHSNEAAELKLPFSKSINNTGYLIALTNTSSETNSTVLDINSTLGNSIKAESESGTAVKATSPFGTALDVNGSVRITGGNTSPGNNKVLTSDASGNAIWKESQAKGLQFPFDTTLNTVFNKPILRIKNTAVNNSVPVAQFENTKGIGVLAISDSSYGVAGYSNSPTFPGLSGGNGNGGPGVLGDAINFPGGVGVKGVAGIGNTSAGVFGDGETSSIGVKGVSGNHIGVYAQSTGGVALQAISTNGNGVYGTSANDHGIIGQTGMSGKAGVAGSTLANGGIGVMGEGYAPNSIGVYAKGPIGTIALEVNGLIKIDGQGQYPGVGKTLTSDANGIATWVGRIGYSVFNAYETLVPVNVWVKVPFAAEEFDGSNNFNTATNSFTVPIKGLYNINTQVSFKDYNHTAMRGSIKLVYKRNGVIYTKALRNAFADAEWPAGVTLPPQFYQTIVASISGDFYFFANDEVWIEVEQNNNTLNYPSLALSAGTETFFNGHLVFKD